ncbi:hypothetical protein LCGC14_0573210 [marine sediment metagenome]|uniref:Uncharacterized protein n=1 Tax=marine sediment metagenome TaxID=412755 RepID=A0A0F9RNS5_9ZZZZ|nr:hypothetical protein [bacterium]
MDVQEFKELIEVCSKKYRHFKDDFDMVFNSMGIFTEELGWMKEELKIANPSMVRSVAKQKLIEELKRYKNFFDKYPEFEPFKVFIRDTFVNYIPKDKIGSDS